MAGHNLGYCYRTPACGRRRMTFDLLGTSYKEDNKEIIIKRSDKGSAVVIQNTTDYIKEAE